MDQLHEELKEPLTECNMSSEGSDSEEIRDGDRSPSEDEFLSCDSGSSSDRGEGGGAGEGELLLQDECDGVRAPAAGTVGVGSTGAVISEKERLKERRVSGSPLRGGSQEMDEDADVDTAAEQGAPERGEEEEPMSTTDTEGQSQENNQLTDSGLGQTQSNTSGIRRAGFMLSFPSFVSKPAVCNVTSCRTGQRSVAYPAPVKPLQSCENTSGAAPQAVLQSTSGQPPPLCRSRILLQKRYKRCPQMRGLNN